MLRGVTIMVRLAIAAVRLVPSTLLLSSTESLCFGVLRVRWDASFPNATAASDCASNCVRGTVRLFSETTSQGVWTGGYRLVNASEVYPANPSMAGQQLCYCELNTWCPDEYVDPSPANPFHLTNIDRFQVSVRTNAQFHAFGVSTTVDGTWLMADILAMGGYTYEQIRANGIDLLMSFEWNCYVPALNTCQPTLKVDTLIPTFNFHMAEVRRHTQQH